LKTKGVQLIYQCEMLKTISSLARLLQVESKISGKNTKSDKHTRNNILTVRAMQLLKKNLTLLKHLKNR
jgi:hypothetical protein